MNLVLTLCALLAGLAAAPPPVEYAAGQVWTYDARPGEENSRLYIALVETLPNGEPVYHIALDGLSIQTPGGVESELGHAPVSRATLDASVTEKVADGAAMPDIREGYASWRAAFDDGGAGIWDVPVRDIVAFIEQALSNG